MHRDVGSARVHARIIVGALAVLLIAGQASGAPVRPQRGHLTVDQQLMQRLRDGTTDRFIVEFEARADLGRAHGIKNFKARGRFVVEALRKTADRSQRAALSVVRQTPGASASSFFLRNAMLVSGNGKLAERLARLPGVSAVRAERVYPLIDPIRGQAEVLAAAGTPEWGVEKIGADQAWASGVIGQGVVVANIDTGVDYLHEAIVNQYRGNNGDGTFSHDYNWWDPTGICGDAPCDNAAHGTHVMGTIVGGDGPGPFEPDIGVAPGARWIAAKGCEDFSCTEGSLLSSGQFMLAPTDAAGGDPDPDRRPDIVNNSWGGGPGDTFYLEVVQAWRAAGIIPVFANGNAGPECATNGSPGDYLESFSIGATDIDDEIAGFSSRGPSVFGKTSPDVSAPGVDVLSSVPGDGYASFSGTSMATPHVTGALALIMSAEPALIGQFEGATSALLTTAVPRLDDSCGGDESGIPNNVYGMGRIDANAAVQLVATGGTLAGTVSDSDTGDPIAGARVTANNGARDFGAVTDAAGEYRLFLAADTYTVTATAFGYEPAVVPDVVIETDETTTVNVALTPLPRFDVFGYVTGAEDGSPLADVSIVALATPVPAVTTDATGFYRLTLPIGFYTLRASAGGCTETGFAEVELVDSDVNQDFSLARKIDDFGHGCRQIALNWINAGTDSALYGDEFAGRLDLPFEFSFYGQSYDQLFISENGYVNFLAADQNNWTPIAIPNPGPPNAAIYPLWMDFELDNTSRIRYATVGTEPERTFVLEYHQVKVFAGTQRVDFEIQLHENGRIDLLYGNNPANPGDGRRATVGIESHEGTDALQFSFFERLLGPNVAYRYERMPTGFVRGQVVDRNDGLPIAGARVTAQPSGRSATTDSDGMYSLRLLPGNYEITASADFYVADSAPAVVTADTETELNFSLAAPIGSVEPTEINAVTEFNVATQATVTVSNTGTAPLFFEAREKDRGSTPAELPTLGRIKRAPTWTKPQLPAGVPRAATRGLPPNLLDTVITDPAGDALGNVDVTTVRGGADDTDMTLAIDFAPGSAMNQAVGFVFFDTDQDPSTGFPPEELFGQPSQDVGVDYFADLFLIHEDDPVVLIVSADFDIVAVVPVTISDNSIIFDVPLGALGGDDGSLNLAMIAGNFVQPTDWAPDAGHGTIEPFSDAPWLSVDTGGDPPNVGEVGVGESLDVTLTLGGPGFSPGVYEALLIFLTNDPRQRTLTVDVSLEILVTEGFGAIAGQVSDAHSGAPLDATVTLHAEWPPGTPLDISVSATNGQYLLFGPAGSWSVDFGHDGYVGQTRDVEITAGFTSTGVDAELHRLQAHAQLDGGPLIFELLPGQTGQQTLTLSNPEGHEDLAFTIREAMLAVGTNESTSARPANVNSRSVPAGSTRRAAPREIDGSPVLVLMDFFPWDSDALLMVLDANGIPFDIAGRSDMGALDLSAYKVVFIASDQPQAFYDAYQANSPWIDAYVQGGGVLWFGAAAWGFSDGQPDGLELPGGATIRGPHLEELNFVGQPDHPLMAGVPDPFFGSFASHAAFENLPDGTAVIATGAGSGMPTLIEYDWGVGRVLAFGQTLEWAWMFGEDGGRILENGVPYAYSFIPFSDVPWLSVDPVEGTIEPDGSMSVEVTVDTDGLETGLYGARLVIQTNDPDNRTMTVPVLLSVIGYRQGINAGGVRPYETAGGVAYSADRVFAPGSFGYVKGSRFETRQPIAGTDDDPLYQSQREAMEAYRFTVPNGRYRVTLQFAELKYRSPGQREFSVGIEGQPVLFQVDIYALAGDRYVAYDFSAEVDVEDGVIDIAFIAGRGDRPIVNAILVTHVPTNAGATSLH